VNAEFFELSLLFLKNMENALRQFLFLSFVIHVNSKSGRISMPDWIEKMAAGEQAQAEAASKAEEIRLINAKIISGKAPQFWAATIDSLEKDAAKLRAQFPSDNRKHCSVMKMGRGIKVQGAKLPWLILDFETKFEERVIDVFENEKLSRTEETDGSHYHVEITVGNDDALQFKFRYTKYTEPAALAEAIIKYVCRLSS
jgi:hypothetical protein